MKHFVLAMLGVLLVAVGSGRGDEDPAGEKIDAKLLKLHRDEAQRWEMFVDPERTEQAAFVAEAVYRWNNRSRANGQSGAMFVWTHGGRPVVLGGVFSNPEQGRRVIMHEFHALGPERLFPRLTNSNQEWLPGAGVSTFPLPDAPAPEPTAARRTLQMRELARRFTAHSIDDGGARWQLRLLSRPLYRYEKPEGEILDGTLFAFVSDAGTDPEIVLVLEAIKEGKKETWRYRPVRFSISSLYVQYKEKEIWTSLRDDPAGPFGNADNTYGLIRDRLVDELPELRKTVE